MQKTTTIDIKVNEKEKKTITVKELSIADILSFLDGGQLNIGQIITDIPKLLPKITDLSVKEVEKLFPNDLQLIYDAFKEVNSVFFSLLTKLELDKTLKEALNLYKEILLSTYKKAFADLSRKATDTEK